MRTMPKNNLFFLFLLFPFLLNAQVDNLNTEETEEDFEKYANLSIKDGSKNKAYCSSKILAQTPNRLIGIGYEVFGPFKLSTNGLVDSLGNVVGTQDNSALMSHGLRLEANFPVVSTNKVIFSLGGAYSEQNYVFKKEVESTVDNPMFSTLKNGSIRNLSIVGTLFKPFDEKNFLLTQVLGEYAGDWTFLRWQNPAFIKLSATAIYGRKTNERKMWGVGLTRTYRAGEVNYLPVFLFNYTSRNEKWGLEMLLPARADFRYNISKRNIIKAGIELEGTSYRLNDRNRAFADSPLFQGKETNKLELRRSDIRLRAIWDFPVKNFYWLSLSAGYRLVYRYNVDQGEIYRGFGLVSDAPYQLENSISGALFISVNACLVSP
jgi:hypothetical protein